MRYQLNIFVLAVLIICAGIAGAIGQTAFTAFVSGLPQATLPLTGSELVAIQQGGSMKQVSVTNLRAAGGSNFIAASGTLTVGNCLQVAAASPPAASSASGPCVVPGPAPFLMAN